MPTDANGIWRPYTKDDQELLDNPGIAKPISVSKPEVVSAPVPAPAPVQAPAPIEPPEPVEVQDRLEWGTSAAPELTEIGFDIAFDPEGRVVPQYDKEALRELRRKKVRDTAASATSTWASAMSAGTSGFVHKASFQMRSNKWAPKTVRYMRRPALEGSLLCLRMNSPGSKPVGTPKRCSRYTL